MSPLKELTLETDATEALLSVLRAIPFLSAEFMSPPSGLDMLIRVSTSKTERLLIGEFKSSGQPRIARDAIEQVQKRMAAFPDAYGIFLAPYITSEVAELCTARGFGYADLSGNCRLTFDNVFIRVDGQPNRFAQKRDLRSLYSPKAARVLRVLLKDARNAWKTTPLAEEANVSLGQVANVKKLLVDREWVEETGDGFRLTQPEALLTEWANTREFRKDKRREYYSLTSGSELERKIAQACADMKLRYAFAEFSAALRYAPMVKSPKLTFYCDGSPVAFSELASRVGMKAVTTGTNVAMIQPGDEGVYFNARMQDGIMVSSPLQVYLDLMRLGGRGNEAADAILERVLRLKW